MFVSQGKRRKGRSHAGHHAPFSQMHGSLKTTAGASWPERKVSCSGKKGAPCAGVLRTRAPRSLASGGVSSWGMCRLARGEFRSVSFQPGRRVMGKAACVQPAHARDRATPAQIGGSTRFQFVFWRRHSHAPARRVMRHRWSRALSVNQGGKTKGKVTRRPPCALLSSTRLFENNSGRIVA